jgi:hypothetical protein
MEILHLLSWLWYKLCFSVFVLSISSYFMLSSLLKALLYPFIFY